MRLALIYIFYMLTDAYKDILFRIKIFQKEIWGKYM